MHVHIVGCQLNLHCGSSRRRWLMHSGPVAVSAAPATTPPRNRYKCPCTVLIYLGERILMRESEALDDAHGLLGLRGPIPIPRSLLSVNQSINRNSNRVVLSIPNSGRTRRHEPRKLRVPGSQKCVRPETDAAALRAGPTGVAEAV